MDTSRYDSVLKYAKMYKAFMTTDMDLEKESILQCERTKLIEKQGHELVVVIEKIIDYEKFGGSPELLKFINQTKSLVMSVVKNPKIVLPLILKWENENPQDIYRTDAKKCLSNLTIAQLTLFTYEYLAIAVNRSKKQFI